MHATEFLQQARNLPVPGFIVLYGKDQFLCQSVKTAFRDQILGGDADNDERLGEVRLAGKETEWKSLNDELRLRSMWGERRLIVVENGDEFVSANRARLEKIVERSGKSSVLVLELQSFPGNTKLAKLVNSQALSIECSELTGGRLLNWMRDVATKLHNKQLDRNAAELLVELVGGSMTLLSSELEKLATYVGEIQRITTADVEAIVGGWRLQTTWAMLDAVRDGQLHLALQHLDQLLNAGEAPQKLLGGMVFYFRKYAEATERLRNTKSFPTALKESKIFPRDHAPATEYLRRIGRPRAEMILELLSQADLGMKGDSSLPERMQMELLIVSLSQRHVSRV